MEPLLELSDVVKEFSSRPPVRPLDGLSMVVPPSTMIAVTGVSGKGKSTLLNVMGGLLRPEAGSVRYRKIDLTQATAAQIDDIHRRGIGFVFQTPYLFQALTAYENLELALRASGEKVVRDRIFEMLEKLGLSERAEHLPSGAIRWVRSADWCSAVRFSPITMCCWRTSRRMTWMRNGRSASSSCCAASVPPRGGRWFW